MVADPKAPKPTQEEAYAQLRYLQSVYSQQYELIEEQIASYTLSIDGVRKGSVFLGDVKSAHKKNTLVSLGGGAYIEATFGDINKTMVYVGAGYLVEKSVAEAKLFVDNTLKKQEESLKRLDADRRKLQEELMSVAYKMESMQPQQR